MTVNNLIALPESGQSSRQVNFATETGLADRVHLLGVEEIHAINAAIMAGRPLLVRGEPGTGKSQLARAAAALLKRVFIQHVIDSHTEARDLLWSFDAVKRLAEAQLVGALNQDLNQAREELAVERFLHPGPLWWAFDWENARQQADRIAVASPPQRDGGDWSNGSVFLLDEIDKAESEVPNGLLEALGSRSFIPMGRTEPVRAVGTLPLVVITTNEERALPDAFLRRCLVLRLRLPHNEEELVNFLVARGRAHYPKARDAVLRRAAKMLHENRLSALSVRITPRPGQAEYLDLLRAVLGLATTEKEQLNMLEVVAQYTLKKNRDQDVTG
ncbi:MAG: AAA family ATPase [Magnetococcales bacterium]|nr:AAA family ATPase [Magnetococcales bacterium]